MARKIGKIALAMATVLLTGLTPLSAQQGPSKPAPQPPQAGAPTGPGAALATTAPALTLPDSYKLNMMIRTAIIALNQANQTGNYTVLRDLGAASFRASNDASRLAEIFADLRRRKIDLSPILFFMPKLVQQPQINERGLIRLAGYFETAPERINFDVYYVFEAGEWRLFGIGVLLKPAVEATSALPQPNNPTPTPQSAAAAPSAEAPAKPAAAPAGRTSPKPPAKASESPAATGPAKPDKAAVENKTISNTARIQLGAPAAPAAPPNAAPPPSEAEAPAAKEKPKDGFLSLW
jgi:hypothetical protein